MVVGLVFAVLAPVWDPGARRMLTAYFSGPRLTVQACLLCFDEAATLSIVPVPLNPTP